MKNFKVLNASVDPQGSSGASGASGANNVSGSQGNSNGAGNAAFTKELQETIQRVEILMKAMETETVAKKNIETGDKPASTHSYTFNPSDSSNLWKRLTGG